MSRFVDPSDDAMSASRGSSETPRSSARSQQRIAVQLYETYTHDAEHQRAKKVASVSPQRRPTGSLAQRPSFLVCYLCGQQFSKGSLGIHQPQCYVKRLIEWERGGAGGARGPKPIHPDDMTHTRSGVDTDAAAFNEQQFTVFNTQTLSQCEYCGRTFLPERLVVHQRSCKPGSTAKPVRRSNSPPLAAAEPHAFLQEVVIHSVAKISDRMVAEASNGREGDVNDSDLGHTQRPTRGSGASVSSGTTGQELRCLHAAAATSLVRCQYCQRTFAPGRLDRHEGVCVERKAIRTQVVKSSKSGTSPSTSANTSFSGAAVGQHPLSAAPRGGSFSRPSNRSPAALSASPQQTITSPVAAAVVDAPLRSPQLASSAVITSGCCSPVIDLPPDRLTPPPLAPKYCTECGFKLYSPSQKFCGECGTRIPLLPQ